MNIYQKLATDMFNGEHPEAEGNANLMYTEVVVKDCYRIKELQQRGLVINNIIDIGANTGLFSLLTRELYPQSNLIAIEPFPESYNYLVKNLSAFSNVKILTNPYGSGNKVELVNAEFTGLNYCKPSDSGIETINLTSLDFDKTLPYMIKSDCEGGELAFFKGVDFEIVKNAILLSMEVHLDKYNPSLWEEFYTKIKETHDILTYVKRTEFLCDFVALKKGTQLKPQENFTLTAYVSTKGRYFSTLPSHLFSLLNQTLLPNKIQIFDDNAPADRVDLREITIYKNIFALCDAKRIQWEVIFGEGNGQVKNHQKALDMATTDLVFRGDDDCILEANVFAKLVPLFKDPTVAVVASCVLHPTGFSPLISLASNKIEDIDEGLNIQWFTFKEIKEVDHCYSTFVYRKSAAKHTYCKNLSPVGHMEECLFSFGFKQAGYKLLVNPEAVIWHCREGQGGIRTNNNFKLWEQDKDVFNNLLQTWGIKKNQYKFIVLDNGLGDHLMLKSILPEIKEKHKDKQIIISCCYPEVFKNDNLKLISIQEMKQYLMFRGGPHIDEWNIYKKAWDLGRKMHMIDVFREMYLK